LLDQPFSLAVAIREGIGEVFRDFPTCIGSCHVTSPPAPRSHTHVRSPAYSVRKSYDLALAPRSKWLPRYLVRPKLAVRKATSHGLSAVPARLRCNAQHRPKLAKRDGAPIAPRARRYAKDWKPLPFLRCGFELHSRSQCRSRIGSNHARYSRLMTS